MNKNLLLAVLALQLGLIAWLGQKDDASQEGQIQPISVPAEAVDGISIQQADENIELARENEHWVLTNSNNLPVAEGRVERVLDSLSKQSLVWPVSTSASSLERFEVSDDKPNRRVILRQGDEVVADWLMGTSPGFRQVHARQAGDSRVFNLALNDYDFSLAVDSWLDQGLLAAKSVSWIRLGGQEWEKSDGQWRNQSNEVMAVDERLKKWIVRLAGLRIGKPVDATSFEALSTADWRRFEVLSGEEKYSYDWLEHDGEYFVRRNDWQTDSGPIIFSSNQYDYELLTSGPFAPAQSLSKEE